MLLSLRIANYVLIEDSRIEFHSGLNVLTGETGAGKSIILDALSLLTGERVSNEAARDAEKDAVVEAAFQLNPKSQAARNVKACLDEFGVPYEDDVLLIKRILSPGGRNRIFINNTQCLLKQLKEIGSLLIDVHGQHEHQSLLHKSGYLPLLDEFGKTNGALENYQAAYQIWTKTKAGLERLELDERERLQREDMLRFQCSELRGADLRAGELEEIDARLQVMRNSEKLSQACSAIVNRLSEGDGEPPILDALDQLEPMLQDVAQIDPAIKPQLDNWQGAVIALKETAREIETYAAGLEFDPQELEELQQRRFQLRDLMKKYGPNVDEMIAYLSKVEDELQKLEKSEETRELLQAQERADRARMIEAAKALHKLRSEKAKTLSRQVTKELQSLGMEQAKFVIDVNYRASDDGLDFGEKEKFSTGPNGADDVEFLVTTIPGKPPRPLREVASGGEISRIMLALKCTFGEADPVPTMIFDEIDVGIGGKTAETVAERLAGLAGEKQIICITHLPHIASRADINFSVEKRKEKGQLVSAIKPLEGPQREAELARMLGGEDSAASKRYAKELLKAAKR